MAVIHLVRHGQAKFGDADYDQLSARGLEQARITGKALSELGVTADLAICGGMRRHCQTAEVVLGALRNTPQQWCVDPDWDEFDHQSVIAAYCPEYANEESLRRDIMSAPDPRLEFQTLFEKAVARWVSGKHDADYEESWAAFCARCRSALKNLDERASQTVGGILVFTSGGPIAGVVKELLSLPDYRVVELSWMLVNCGITKLIAGQRGIRLATLNGHAHFDGAKADLITYR